MTPQQRQIIQLKKAGKDPEEIAQALKLKTHQVTAQWSKLYLSAQSIRILAKIS